eukprot:scaffold1697_cov120-Cylindrotheca_fusiformis.AAC.37
MRRPFPFVIFLLLCNRGLETASFPIYGCSASFSRSVTKAASRIKEFGRRGNATLVIDGNNVRGIGRFESDLVEVQDRISSFCQETGISRVVTIWDHGNCKFAAIGKDSNNVVDMIVVFSGPNQRADDVMVKEANHLASMFCSDDWSSLCFVSNDRMLQQKLIQRIGRSGSGGGQKTRSLLMDSTRFSELIFKQQKAHKLDAADSGSHQISKVKMSLQNFLRTQKQGCNRRREMTWERCVLAESLRRFYCGQKMDFSKDLFSHRYIRELEKRGYANPNAISNNTSSSDMACMVLGPTRLDRRQKQILRHFNNYRLADKF